MDEELLLALCVLWLSSTIALISCMLMWFFNEGESFHPHSVDVDHRHSLFVVVHSNTCCKLDCCVKSISEFIAPRGSSSSKLFTVLCAMISVAGFLGTFRWFKVGDGQLVETILSLSGFASLLLVAIFELNVSPEKYLEDKIMVTGWLLQKLKLDKKLPFNTNDVHSEDFRQFLRSSKDIYFLYDEDHYIMSRSSGYNKWKKSDMFWLSMHMVGATAYVVLVTAAVLLNDLNEHPVAWITGACFCLFSTLGYFTGHYVPVFKSLRCWLLLWNPFLREPHFMLRLQQAVDSYISADSGPTAARLEKRKKTRRLPTRRLPTPSTTADSIMLSQDGHASVSSMVNVNVPRSRIDLQASEQADQALDNFSLQFARSHPVTYLKVVGHLLVMSELIAMLTPAIAMGIQWVTALCDGPPVPALIDLFSIGVQCIGFGDCAASLEDSWKNCILKEGN